jgi:hypothetical protein
MPMISRVGRVLAGQGGVQGSMDGAYFPFPSWGGGCWLSPTSALVATRDDALAEWVPGTDPVPVSQGANDWAAHHHAWIAWRAGYGVFGSLEFRLPGTPAEVRAQLAIAGTCGPRAVGPDGSIAYIPNRDVGLGIRLVDEQGGVIDVPSVVPWDVQVLDRGVMIWRGGAIGRAPTRPAVADATNVQLHVVDGADWLLYWSETYGLVLQPDGSAYGWVLDPRPLACNPSAALVGDELQIAWSINQGEGPHDIVICGLTPQGTIEYRRTALGWSPQTPVWRDLGTPPPVDQPRFVFTHPAMTRPFFASGSGMPDVFTLGTYTEATTLPDPLPEGRLVVTHDSPADWTIPTGLRPFDLLLLEYYRLKSESLAATVNRWQRQTESLLAQWPGDCGVIPQFYGQGGAPPNELWTVPEILDGLQHLSALVNRSPRIKVIAPFAYQRANGIVAHPELQEAFANLCAACDRVGEPALIAPGGPIDPPIEPIDPPIEPIEPPDPGPTPEPVPPLAPFFQWADPFPVRHARGT